MKKPDFHFNLRNLTFACLLFLSGNHVLSQENPVIQDPAAEKILEKVAVKFNSLISIQADFELVIQDRKENTKNSSKGNLVMKQKKYVLTNQGSTVYFDGKTMWTHILAGNEVTITEPDATSPDFLSNPSAFFSSYKETFKYKFVRQTTFKGIQCHEIDLFPKNLNQPYSRIKVLINATSDLPVSISSIGKDGVDYTVFLSIVSTNKSFPDSTFIFDTVKNRKVEVIDMRGL